MTARTPAQMRELADEHPFHGMYPGTWNHDVVAALRAAADRQEAVEALLEVTPVLMYGIPPKPVDVVLADDIRKALGTTPESQPETT